MSLLITDVFLSSFLPVYLIYKITSIKEGENLVTIISAVLMPSIAVEVIPPAYRPPPRRGRVRGLHFRALGSAVSGPVMRYGFQFRPGLHPDGRNPSIIRPKLSIPSVIASVRDGFSTSLKFPKGIPSFEGRFHIPESPGRVPALKSP